MEIPHVARGSKRTGQKKPKHMAKRRPCPNQWGNVVFLYEGPCQEKANTQGILWFMGNLRNAWEKHGFQCPELATCNSNPRRFPAHG